MRRATDTVRIRRIRRTEGLLLRQLRLSSLADAPDAFGQTMAEARARPEDDWHRAARRSSRGNARTWLFAETGPDVVGLVQGRRRRPSTLLLFSMWVEPRRRRLGVGRMLVAELESWARGWDASETMLWVFGGNSRALGFYRDLGFEIVRHGQDAESGTRYGALAMRRAIRGPSTVTGVD